MPLNIRTLMGPANVWRAAAAFACSLAVGAMANADAVTDGQVLAQKAIDAEKAGDAASAADLYREALRLRPNHPGLTIRIAQASLAAGRPDDAVGALEDYAAMGLTAAIEDEKWDALATHPRWKALRARFAKNAAPVGDVSVAATVAETALIAEGIAYDASNGQIYVGSVHKRKIIRLGNDGVPATFVPQARDGLLGVFGLALHVPGKTLWSASSALPHVAGLDAGDKGRAGVFAFDLAGRLIKRVMLPLDGKEHVLGDLTISAQGDVYATDSIGPAVYRLRAGADALETLVSNDTFHSLQGIALSPDERRLAVADYSSGIHVVDVAKGTSVLLAMPPHATLHGVDALVAFGRDLLGVQNGIAPQRVIRIRLYPSWTAVEGVDVLAANLPQMDEPTLATRIGDDLLVIGNGQWSRFKDDGTLDGSAPFAPTRIVRLKLPKARP